MAITNEAMARHPFLAGMYRHDYFPDHLVDKGRDILVRLCERIETERPADLPALYALTDAATEEFNALQPEFEDADSDLETEARAVIIGDFVAIARAYGHPDAEAGELTAGRDF